MYISFWGFRTSGKSRVKNPRVQFWLRAPKRMLQPRKPIVRTRPDHQRSAKTVPLLVQWCLLWEASVGDPKFEVLVIGCISLAYRNCSNLRHCPQAPSLRSNRTSRCSTIYQYIQQMVYRWYSVCVVYTSTTCSSRSTSCRASMKNSKFTHDSCRRKLGHTCEANVLVLYSLHVEPDGGDRRHHLS